MTAVPGPAGSLFRLRSSPAPRGATRARGNAMPEISVAVVMDGSGLRRPVLQACRKPARPCSVKLESGGRAINRQPSPNPPQLRPPPACRVPDIAVHLRTARQCGHPARPAPANVAAELYRRLDAFRPFATARPESRIRRHQTPHVDPRFSEPPWRINQPIDLDQWLYPAPALDRKS